MTEVDGTPVKTAEEQLDTLRGLRERIAEAANRGAPAKLGMKSEVDGGTPLTTEGPYYIPFDDSLVRRDITEGREGLPLTLRVIVLDASTRDPIEGAAVDIWQCDAFGYYSGHTGDDPDSAVPGGHIGPEDDQRFLRGVQYTGADGVAEFDTIYPGWYHMRAVHLHVKAHLDGVEVFTGHIFLPEEYNDLMSSVPPYNEHTTLERIPNAMDLVYEESGGDEALAKLQPITPGKPELGLRGDYLAVVVRRTEALDWVRP